MFLNMENDDVSEFNKFPAQVVNGLAQVVIFWSVPEFPDTHSHD